MSSYELKGTIVRDGEDNVYSGTLLVRDGPRDFSFNYHVRLPSDLSKIREIEGGRFDSFVVRREDGQEVTEIMGRRAIIFFIMERCFLTEKGLRNPDDSPFHEEVSLDNITDPSIGKVYSALLLRPSRVAYGLEEPPVSG